MGIRFQKLSIIMYKAVEPFMGRADELVHDDLCSRCPQVENCTNRCEEARVYFDQIIALLISQIAKWN